MNKLLALLLVAWATISSASAQTCPTFATGMVLTAAQWNACFSSKQNALGYIPVNKGGDVMAGVLKTVPSTASVAGFAILPGTAPSSPNDGDLWMTTLGLFTQVDGVTIGPLSGPTSASFAATSPITVTFPASVVTYAFNFSVANSWLATQTMRTILAGTTNTYDIGTSAAASAFRTVYAGTSFVGPVGTFTTSVAAGGCTIGSHALCATGTANISGATTIGGAITYGGVTFANTSTGSGSLVGATAPTISSPVFTTAFTATGLVTNAALADMAQTTFKGRTLAGGTGAPADLTAAQAAAIIGSVGGAIKSKVLQFTRVMTANTSAGVTNNGFGFTPITCSFFSGNVGTTSSSFGFSGSDLVGSVVGSLEGGAGATTSTSQVVRLLDATAANGQIATVVSYDADGVTLAWTKIGSGVAGTADIMIKCLR